MFQRLCLVFSVIFCACGDAPATIEYVDLTPAHPKINEIATIKFRLLDYRGVPMAGTTVTFTVEGGDNAVVLSPKSSMSIKGSGEVTTQVIAGTGVNSVIVKADAGGGRIAVSPPISFAGSVPNGAQLTFQCGSISGAGSGGIHAIGAYDDTRNLIAGVKLNCIAHIGDRNGDGVFGASVSFLTEAGTIGPTETSQTDVVGNAQILYKTSLPLPKEVPPGVFQWNPDTTCADPDASKSKCNGEYLVPLWMEPNSWTRNPLATLLTGTPAYNANNLEEPRRNDPIRRTDMGMAYQNNPRDNLVALIAVTQGEEGYRDNNGNGVHDSDETDFDDLTEPFVDSNDNGTWDPGEKFVDTNNNGSWDGKNGKWDANTLIWKQERIIWTGAPFFGLYGAGAGMSQADDTTAPEPTYRSAQPLVGRPLITCKGPPGPAVPLAIIASDPWFNSLAQDGDDDGCEKIDNSDNIDIKGAFKGRAITYPPVRSYSFLVVDKLQRTPQPMTNPPSPGCYPPPPAMFGSTRQQWYAGIICRFSASPEEGHKIFVTDTVYGDIDNNLPNVP
jgi:hypothetical protein